MPITVDPIKLRYKNMASDFDKTFKELKARRGKGRERKTHGIYLNTRVLRAFQNYCESNGHSASEVLEYWMIQALEKAGKLKK